MSPWDIITALQAGARGALGVAMACATAGIIVGVVTLTGIGLKMANGLVDIAGGNLFFTLFFTMITSLILGMGVPTTANYVITSTIAAPALVMLGVPLLAAHLFVFYFGIVADITPPVALAAYAGSGIAKSNPFWTGVTATKLAIGAFIIPYIFVYNPAMILIGTTPLLLSHESRHRLRGNAGCRRRDDRLRLHAHAVVGADLVCRRGIAFDRSGNHDRSHRHRHADPGIPLSVA